MAVSAGGRAALGRNLGERLARQWPEVLVLEREELHVLRPGELEHVLPPVSTRLHLSRDADPHVRVAEPRPPRLEAALLHPGRHGAVQPGRAGRVRVHVGRQLQPGSLLGLDALDDVVELVPVRAARDLEVVDLPADARAAHDREELVQRLEQRVALAPEVSDVHPGRLCERDQLVRLRVERRCVDQRGSEADSAFAHRFGDELLHARELRLRRRPISGAELVLAHRCGPDERRNVRRHAAALEVLEVLAEGRPLDGMAEQRLRLDLLLHRVGERAHREALAHHLERYALADIALRAAVLEQRLRRPAEHVDEPRRDGEAGRVKLVVPAPVGEIAECGDRVAADREVGFDGCSAAAVVDGAPANDEISRMRHCWQSCTGAPQD
jgi:hypothetical protein